MPSYMITDNQSGRKFKVTGDTPPSEAEISMIFQRMKPELTTEVRGNPDASPSETEAMRRDFVAKEGGLATRAREKLGVMHQSGRKTLADMARPTIEGVATAGGAIAGVAGGTAAGLGVGSIPGGVAGGVLGAGLGYSGGSRLADMVEGKERTLADASVQSLKDIGTGATYEMGGQSAAKAIGATVKGVSYLKNNRTLRSIAENRAKDTLTAANQLTPQEAANLAKAKALTDRMKVKLTPAQMTGKPALASIEQGLATADGEFAATLNAQDSTAKKIALNRIQQATGRGAPLPVTQDLQTTGRNLIDTVKTAQQTAKPIHEELYNAIPNTPMPTGNIKATIKDLRKNFRPGDEDVFPTRAIERVEEAIQGPKPAGGGHGGHGAPPPKVILDAQGLPIRQNMDTTKAAVGFQDLHSLRKDIGRQIQDATTGANPNRELAAKLQRIKGAIDDTIEQTMGVDNQYKAAKDAFIDYADKYRTGNVAKVMQKGRESNGLRIAEENVGKQFFTPSGADGLIKAVGRGQAKEQMKAFVVNDMVKNGAKDGVNFNVTAGVNYIQKNRVTLEKLGLVDDARQVLKSQFPAEMERDLLKRAPDASGQSFYTAQDMRNILQKHGNTIKTLYGPQTLSAYRDYNALMGLIERKNIIPRGSGSNTAEKAMNVANLMIKESVGPAKKMTDGLLWAISQGAGFSGGASMLAGNGSAKVAIVGGGLMAARQMVKNGQGKVAQTFTKILQDATLNPQLTRDLMTVKRTGKVPQSLQIIIDSHLTGGVAAGMDE
jgi:hypothetical protein